MKTLITIFFSIHILVSPIFTPTNDHVKDLNIVETTEHLTALCESADLLDFSFPEESYISDIPFNTSCLAAEIKHNNAVEEDFEFEEEIYIGDIPFDTKETVNSFNYIPSR